MEVLFSSDWFKIVKNNDLIMVVGDIDPTTMPSSWSVSDTVRLFDTILKLLNTEEYIDVCICPSNLCTYDSIDGICNYENVFCVNVFINGLPLKLSINKTREEISVSFLNRRFIEKGASSFYISKKYFKFNFEAIKNKISDLIQRNVNVIKNISAVTLLNGSTECGLRDIEDNVDVFIDSSTGNLIFKEK